MGGILLFVQQSPSNIPIHAWCIRNKEMFKENNREVIILAQDTLKQYPHLINANKPSNVDADPFIIAKARSLKNNLVGDNPIIITHEKNRENKIPFVANAYGIKCVTLIEFFRMKGWKF